MSGSKISHQVGQGFLVASNRNRLTQEREFRDFPGGPVIQNPPCNAGDMNSIPGQGTRIPHTARQLSPCARTTESSPSRAHEPRLARPCIKMKGPA